jgi:hypothetical protein
MAMGPLQLHISSERSRAWIFGLAGRPLFFRTEQPFAKTGGEERRGRRAAIFLRKIGFAVE